MKKYREFFSTLTEAILAAADLPNTETENRAKPVAGSGDAGEYPWDIQAWGDKNAQAAVERGSRC